MTGVVDRTGFVTEPIRQTLLGFPGRHTATATPEDFDHYPAISGGSPRLLEYGLPHLHSAKLHATSRDFFRGSGETSKSKDRVSLDSHERMIALNRNVLLTLCAD
jgi:hypothetical protein